jgi:hypothetical protein
MMSDFPQPPISCQTAWFADDIKIHNITKWKAKAETNLQAYLYEVKDWVKQ